MSTLFDFIILSVVLFYAFMGWEVGIWTASIAALELLGCLSVAVLLHESVAGFLHPWMLSLISEELSQTWAVFIAFGGLSWGLFAAIRFWLHKVESVNPDEVDIDPLSDRIGGVIAGGFGGALFVGGILVTASMVPFLAPMKPSGDRLLLDVGKLVLVSAGHFVLDKPDGLPLPIWGEPASTKADMRALLTNEPWFDVDDSGEFSEADRYRDVDGGGTYSKDLYFVDVDRDGKRRLGLVDKYVIGCWDGFLIRSAVRPRMDVKQNDPKSKKRKKKGDEEAPPEVTVPTDEF